MFPTPLMALPASSATCPPLPALLNFSAATVSTDPSARVKLRLVTKEIRPPVSPEASIVPVTVMSPISAESA